MKIVIAGASGMLGRALVTASRARGHAVVCLVRRPLQNAGEARWDPSAGELDASVLDGANLVVNLCGTGIADRRWSVERKLELWESRILSTRTLVSALGRMETKPARFVCASAVGFYGDRGEERLREDSGPGVGFLSDLCQAWEGEAAKAVLAGVGTVSLRLGVVLSPEGGMLARLLPAFRFGLGCTLGDGRAWLSWISLQDAVGAILDLPGLESPSAALNLVAPGVLRAEEFNRVVAKFLHRPCLFRVPGFLVRAAFGELAREALLASVRAEPAVLLGAGFRFSHPDLDSALASML
jgi:uncharacterized protein (TIGR01777 family)